jgi:PAS domain S-box-containing protein
MIMVGLDLELLDRERLDQFIFEAKWLDTLNEGVVIVGPDGLVAYCNDVTLALLGIESNDAIGCSLFDPIVDPVGLDGLRLTNDSHPVAVTLRTGVPCTDVIVGLKTWRGSRKWLSHQTSPIISGGQVTGVFCTLDDVTNSLMELQTLKLLTVVNRLAISPPPP